MAARYPDDKAELAGFLYRQAVTAKKPAYLSRWSAIEKEVFPNGLQPMAAAMPQKPEKGVFVEEDSYWSRKVRLQAGDIIVGVDGWKVDSKEQYDALVKFLPPHTKHKLTAWRGILFTVDLYAYSGMTLKTYPLKGWIE
jgi:S1-C subfamily serine protease